MLANLRTSDLSRRIDALPESHDLRAIICEATGDASLQEIGVHEALRSLPERKAKRVVGLIELHLRDMAQFAPEPIQDPAEEPAPKPKRSRKPEAAALAEAWAENDERLEPAPFAPAIGRDIDPIPAPDPAGTFASRKPTTAAEARRSRKPAAAKPAPKSDPTEGPRLRKARKAAAAEERAAKSAPAPEPGDGLRSCSGCPKRGIPAHRTTPESFPKNRAIADGLSRTCRACNAAYAAQRKAEAAGSAPEADPAPFGTCAACGIPFASADEPVEVIGTAAQPDAWILDPQRVHGRGDCIDGKVLA
jgi:hypothetical protein